MKTITPDETLVAYHHAISFARDMISTETGALNPNSRLGSLSDFEWQKLAGAMVSGWIIKRSQQLTTERFADESFFLATGEMPEPRELGTCATALPALGGLVETLGLTDKPIGSWTKQDVLLFVWTAFELVTEARTSRDERPGPVEVHEMLVLAA